MSTAKNNLNELIAEYQKIYQHLDSVYRSLNDDASIADLPCRINSLETQIEK